VQLLDNSQIGTFLHNSRIETFVAPGPRDLPKLELVLKEPESGGSTVPKLIDTHKETFRRIGDETDKMGVQSIAWVEETLKDCDKRWRAAKKAFIAEHPDVYPPSFEIETSPLEKYALELKAWYKDILTDALSNYRAESQIARMVTLWFALENNGTASAEGLEIQLRISPENLVKTSPGSYGSSYCSKALAPMPPPALNLPVPADTSRPELHWYDLSEYRSQQKRRERLILAAKIRLFEETTPESGEKFLEGKYQGLPHGEAVWLWPVYVVFGEAAVQDIEIEYKVHANNQPRATSGSYRVSVRER
jgi:hypothetical protein